MIREKNIEGVRRTSDLEIYSRDFGRINSLKPKVAYTPTSIEELREVVRNLSGMKVVARGHGCSSNEYLLTDSVVIDMKGINHVKMNEDSVILGAGSRWFDAQCTTRLNSLDFPVLTGNPYATVGGTLSVGGFGSRSLKYGAQANNIRSLKLMMASGEILTVSPESDLFRYALCGLGSLGIIVEVEAELVPCISVYRKKIRFEANISISSMFKKIQEISPEYCSLTYDLKRNYWLASLAETEDSGSGDVIDNYAFEHAKNLYSHIQNIELNFVSTGIVNDPQDCINIWCDLMVPLAFADFMFEKAVNEFKMVDFPPMFYCSAITNADKFLDRLPLLPLPNCKDVFTIGVYCQVPRFCAPLYQGLIWKLQKICQAITGKVYLYGNHRKSTAFYLAQFGRDEVEKWSELKHKYDPCDIF